LSPLRRRDPPKAATVALFVEGGDEETVIRGLLDEATLAKVWIVNLRGRDGAQFEGSVQNAVDDPI
jgi:hypothetical protein